MTESEQSVAFNFGKKLRDTQFPKEYSSLIARVCSLYGSDLTIGELLTIDIDEFASKRGVGRLYAHRLEKLKEIIATKGIPCQHKTIQMPINLIDGLTFPSIDLSLKLADTNFPRIYSSLLARIRSIYGPELTLRDITEIDPDSFYSMPGVGKLYTNKLRDLQAQLRGDKALHLSIRNPTLDFSFFSSLDGYVFNRLNLDAAQIKALEKLSRHGVCPEPVLPKHVVEISVTNLESKPKFGRKSGAALASIQKSLMAAIEMGPDKSPLLKRLDFGDSLNIPEVCDRIVEDLNNYLTVLHDRDRIILTQRMGIHAESRTLDEIGQQLSLTRERVRQIFDKRLAELKTTLCVSPEILANKIRQPPIYALLEEIKQFRALFILEEDCLRVIAWLANIDPKEFFDRIYPSVPASSLNDLFLHATRPITVSDLQTYIEAKFELERDVIDNVIGHFIQDGIVDIVEEKIIPLNMKKETAIASLLIGYPEGLSWQQIARLINANGSCRTKLNENRTDLIVQNSEFVFPAGPDLYRHTFYLGISPEIIINWLNDVKDTLNKSPYKSINLRSDYFLLLNNPSCTYHQIRYIVRSFGYKRGLYFHGKSNVDTVSLMEIDKGISQKEGIARALESSEMEIDVIAKRLHSQSTGHARMHLGALLSEGRIVRTDSNTYASPAIAFKGLDINTIIKTINALLSSDNRMFHVCYLYTHVNKIIKTSMTLDLFRSFLQLHGNEFGWHMNGNLVANHELKWRGLANFIRSEAPDISGEDLIAWVQQRVCATRTTIKIAIHNSGLSDNSQSANMEEGGFAADILQELLAL